MGKALENEIAKAIVNWKETEGIYTLKNGINMVISADRTVIMTSVLPDTFPDDDHAFNPVYFEMWDERAIVHPKKLELLVEKVVRAKKLRKKQKKNV